MRSKAVRCWTFISVIVLSSCTPNAESQAAPPVFRKAETGHEISARALLVGVDEVSRESGWWPLHADRDVELMREALLRQGFSVQAITALGGRAATAEGIAAAFERELIAPSKAGDVVVFHYSGHGQRLTDDDGDEVDGYDEALAPYDAPREPSKPYRGERHLRDDRLNDLLTRLRVRLGPQGNVLVVLDSCFSGTATRGDLPVRGAAAIGLPRAGSRGGREAASGVREEMSSAVGGENPRLAPLMVLAATRSDELAYEIPTADRGAVGALSWSVARALASPDLTPTYRGLFDEVRRELAARAVPQEAQAEGDLDTALFSGRAVHQEPFLRIHEMVSGGRRITVQPGTLLGLDVGSEIEVHSARATHPESATRLAFGRVIESSPTRAVIELDRALERSSAENDLANARVFVIARDFGDLRLRVRFVGPVAPKLAKALDEIAAIERVPRRAAADLEVMLAESPGTTELLGIRDLATGALLVPAGGLDAEHLAVSLPQRLESIARNRYLRRIELRDPELPITFEIVPVRLEHCQEGLPESLESCTAIPIARERFLSAGGQLELPVGTYFQVRVLPSARPMHLTILGLVSNGRVELLWPELGAEDPIVSRDRSPRLLHRLFRASTPLGLDAILGIASEEFLDFQPLRSGREITPRSEPPLRGPFAVLFDERRIRERGRAAFAPRSVSTALETVRIVEVRE